jgi:hypothetical protein
MPAGNRIASLGHPAGSNYTKLDTDLHTEGNRIGRSPEGSAQTAIDNYSVNAVSQTRVEGAERSPLPVLQPYTTIKSTATSYYHEIAQDIPRSVTELVFNNGR